jgi:hypothetical protein
VVNLQFDTVLIRRLATLRTPLAEENLRSKAARDCDPARSARISESFENVLRLAINAPTRHLNPVDVSKVANSTICLGMTGARDIGGMSPNFHHRWGIVFSIM